MKRIALHTFHFCESPAMVSTIQLCTNLFETMVMYYDGEEIECIRTHTLQEAKKTHNRLMNKYNDLCYEGSTAKLLGAANLGQFMHTVQSC